MLRKLIFHILIALLALWLANKFLPGLTFQGSIEIFLLCGSALGLSNALIKPILKKIAFPIRILTLGFFNIAINMAILWFIDILFPELVISGILPIFLTTCIIWALSLLSKPLT